MRVPYVNLGAQYADERDAILSAVDAVLASGFWIGGEQVDLLEEKLATYLGVRHAIALNSGTDALIIALRAIKAGPGDEVITAPNSLAATAASIVAVGATPVFADVGYDELIDPRAIEAAIGPNTVAIIPVHLRGSVCRMDEIRTIARRHGLTVIEDAAQSFGSALGGVQAGALGDIGCFSLHPLKGLNACGDGGVLVTDRDDVASYARLFRNHGLQGRETVVSWGTVSRLDALQAAIVLSRLERFGQVVEQRRRHAAIYSDRLAPLDIRMTEEREGEFHTFNTFVVQTSRRDELAAFLAERGVATNVHYKTPLHLQPAAGTLGYKAGDFPIAEHLTRTMLSLPVHQSHRLEDIEYTAEQATDFLAGAAS